MYIYIYRNTYIEIYIYSTVYSFIIYFKNHRSVGMPILYMDSLVAMLPGKLWFSVSSPVNRRRLDEGIDSI